MCGRSLAWFGRGEIISRLPKSSNGVRSKPTRAWSWQSQSFVRVEPSLFVLSIRHPLGSGRSISYEIERRRSEQINPYHSEQPRPNQPPPPPQTYPEPSCIRPPHH